MNIIFPTRASAHRTFSPARTSPVQPSRDDARRAVPKVGDGVTFGAGSDCYPGTVVKVENGVVYVQSDNHKPTAKHEGPYGNQDYTYSRNPKGRMSYYKFYPKKDRWFEVRLNDETGRFIKDEGGRVSFSHRRYYQDPSF